MNTRISIFLGVLLCGLASISSAIAGINAASIRLGGISAITSVYINGASVAPLSVDAKQEAAADYGSNADLKVLAVLCKSSSAEAGPAGFISAIQLSSGGVLSGGLWRVYQSPTGTMPPADANGTQWFEQNYRASESGWIDALVDDNGDVLFESVDGNDNAGLLYFRRIFQPITSLVGQLVVSPTSSSVVAGGTSAQASVSYASASLKQSAVASASAKSASLSFSTEATDPVTGVSATSIQLTASSAITSVYINGTSAALGANAANWLVADNYGANANLQVLAVSCTNTGSMTSAGFIGAVMLPNGRIVTDNLWKAYYSPGGALPPADASGNQWYQLNYNDSGWSNAVVDGCYGVSPWASGGAMGVASNKLDGVMQGVVGSTVTWSAQWIWIGNPAYGVSPVYFRRTFVPTVANATQPPTAPEQFAVTSVTGSSAVLTWGPSFDPAGVTGYRIYWNGTFFATTSSTTYQVSNLPISSFPQNFFYVTAYDAAGNESDPSAFRIAMAPNAQVIQPPANFHITGRGTTGFSMTWDPSPGSAGVSRYVIEDYDPNNPIASGSSYNYDSDFTFSYLNSYLAANASIPADPPNTWDPTPFNPAGTRNNFKIYAVDLFGNSSSDFALSDRYTLSGTASVLAAPTGLSVSASTSTTVTLKWTASATAGVAGYYVYQNGLPAGTLSGTTTTLTGLSSTKSYYFQVAAYDTKGNESANSTLVTAMRGGSVVPLAPQLLDGGRTDTTMVINWTRPVGLDMGSVVNYTFKQWTGSTTTGANSSVTIDPYGFSRSITGLISGNSYTFQLVANGLAGLSATSAPLTLQTVSMPVGQPLFRFASAQRISSSFTNLSDSVADASARGCAFMTMAGYFASQNVTSQSTWASVAKIINAARGTMPIYYTPHFHDGDPTGSLDKYSAGGPTLWLFSQELATPLNYAATPYPGVRLISAYEPSKLWKSGGEAPAVANYAPCPVDNDLNFRQRQNFVLKELQAAHADPTVKWVFFTNGGGDDEGMGLECMSSAAWSYPLLQGSRPVICLTESTNGNPGYQCTWHPGQNFLTTSPQSIRSNYGNYQIYNVYSDRIVVQHRIANSPRIWSTDALHEILYDHANNILTPSQMRSTDAAGGLTHVGKDIPANLPNPPWAQNETVNTTIGQAVNVRLWGRSTQGNALTYTLVQNPTNGVLSGTAPNLTYTPNNGFIGQDILTYQVNDGQPSNLGWIAFNTSDPNAVSATPVLKSAVSRKSHNGTNYDLNLSVSGTTGVECRTTSGTLQLVLTFDRPITSCLASVTGGGGAQLSGAMTFSGSTVSINLASVTNAKRPTLNLSHLNGGSGTASLTLGVLEGDVNGDGRVNIADMGLTNAQSGQPLSSSNFKFDINADGAINSTDVTKARTDSGSALPQ